MIIFDLDGTLADCEHRRHFVKKYVACDHWYQIPNRPIEICDHCKKLHKVLKPDWQGFYEACNDDKPILSTLQVMRALFNYSDFTTPAHIWSGRCESVREKTENWLQKYGCNFSELKMRPIGDNTPDEILKERWLDERIDDMGNQVVSDIDFVFDSHSPSIEMWRRRGIFVFDVSQGNEDF